MSYCSLRASKQNDDAVTFVLYNYAEQCILYIAAVTEGQWLFIQLLLEQYRVNSATFIITDRCSLCVYFNLTLSQSPLSAARVPRGNTATYQLYINICIGKKKTERNTTARTNLVCHCVCAHKFLSLKMAVRREIRIKRNGAIVLSALNVRRECSTGLRARGNSLRLNSVGVFFS